MLFTVEQARKLAGKSQQEMANGMGIHRQTYMKLEKNPDTATIKQAKRIAELTGISVEEIFFGNESTLSGNNVS